MDGHAPVAMQQSNKVQQKFDRFNFDCLAENRQKRQHFPQ